MHIYPASPFGKVKVIICIPRIIHRVKNLCFECKFSDFMRPDKQIDVFFNYKLII